MTDNSRQWTTIATGRPLDEHGEPTNGPALKLDPESPAAEIFQETSYPLISSPGSKTWATILRYPAPDDEQTRPALLVWLAPDASEPPLHVHLDKKEFFRAIEGQLTVVINGEPHCLSPGEGIMVQPGQEHTFRNDTDEFVAFFSELPSTRTLDVQFTLWGLDHDGAYGADGEHGEPGLIQGVLAGEALRDEAVFKIGPLTIQRLLWVTVGRAAKARGHRAVDRKYLNEEFWTATVEQPQL